MILRPLTEAEREVLEEGQHSENASHRRRCQTLLERAKGSSIDEIQRRVDWIAKGHIRLVICEFNKQGVDWLLSRKKKSEQIAEISYIIDDYDEVPDDFIDDDDDD